MERDNQTVAGHVYAQQSKEKIHKNGGMDGGKPTRWEKGPARRSKKTTVGITLLGGGLREINKSGRKREGQQRQGRKASGTVRE